MEINDMYGYTELRTRAYQTEARGYCNKCAIFLDQGQPKNPNLKYLPKEEFDKINDHVADDSVLNVFTVDQILSLLLAIKDFDNVFKYFKDQKDKTDPTVKFYGEMVPSGIYQDFVTPDHAQKFQSLHQCNNPSCKYEKPIVMTAQRYPFIENVIGRMIRFPEELQHPDDVIKNIMKKHVGSTVNQNFKDVSGENPETSAKMEKLSTKKAVKSSEDKKKTATKKTTKSRKKTAQNKK